MKREYIDVDMEIIRFDAEDVITASPTTPGEGGTGGGGGTLD